MLSVGTEVGGHPCEMRTLLVNSCRGRKSISCRQSRDSPGVRRVVSPPRGRETSASGGASVQFKIWSPVNACVDLTHWRRLGIDPPRRHDQVCCYSAEVTSQFTAVSAGLTCHHGPAAPKALQTEASLFGRQSSPIAVQRRGRPFPLQVG